MTSLSMVYVFTLGVGIPTTLQYSVLADITRDTGISTADLVQGTGVMFLFLGWACLFWQPIALAYGRRGVYLVSTLLTVPIMVWTAYSTSAGEWYAHRVLLGIVCSPIESLPEKLNAQYMGLYGFVLFGSNFIAPLIAGWFENAYGWRWTMHFGAMIAALSFFIHLFFMEESMYFRNTVEGIEIGQPAGLSTPSSHSNDNEKSGSVERATSISSLLRTPPPPRTYIQKFNPFLLLEGRPSTRQMFTMMYRPLLMIVLFPSVAWAGFTYGINLSWYQGVGAYHDVHWVGLVFGLGMLTFGVITGGSIALSYNVDCFKEISGESMSAVIVIRNSIGFGISYAITPWYTNNGLQNCFITAGMLSLACTFTFLGMIWKGKDLRRLSAKTYWRYVATSAVEAH
ncbi:hypothetical protein MBLNU459_g7771t1 [Dothideomycetes sp. NU459]